MNNRRLIIIINLLILIGYSLYFQIKEGTTESSFLLVVAGLIQCLINIVFFVRYIIMGDSDLAKDFFIGGIITLLLSFLIFYFNIALL